MKRFTKGSSGIEIVIVDYAPMLRYSERNGKAVPKF